MSSLGAMEPVSDGNLPPGYASHRRLGRSLRARRRLRVGLVQLSYLLGAFLLGALIPRIDIAQTVPTDKATDLLVAAGAGFVPFIGIVYSLLFLVVQFGATMFTPRLSLFRDNPIVWHAFAFFVAVIAFAFTASFAVGSSGYTTVLVPIFLFAFVLVAIVLLRVLQNAAFDSIQLSAILGQVGQRGKAVVDGIYPEPLVDEVADRQGVVHAATATIRGAAGARDVLWPGGVTTLQTVDVLRLLRAAEQADAVVELCVTPGGTLQAHARVAVISSSQEDFEHEVIKALRTGSDRTFEQDPLLALRVLSDIALRALSAAIQDPTTAAQTLDQTEGLLRLLATRDLNVHAVDGSDGQPRVVLKLPDWDTYVSEGLDEIIATDSDSIQIQSRLRRLLGDLLAMAPADRREPLRARLRIVQARDGRLAGLG